MTGFCETHPVLNNFVARQLCRLQNGFLVVLTLTPIDRNSYIDKIPPKDMKKIFKTQDSL